jgi:hypothetical protein
MEQSSCPSSTVGAQLQLRRQRQPSLLESTASCLHGRAQQDRLRLQRRHPLFELLWWRVSETLTPRRAAGRQQPHAETCRRVRQLSGAASLRGLAVASRTAGAVLGPNAAVSSRFKPE